MYNKFQKIYFFILVRALPGPHGPHKTDFSFIFKGSPGGGAPSIEKFVDFFLSGDVDLFLKENLASFGDEVRAKSE